MPVCVIIQCACASNRKPKSNEFSASFGRVKNVSNEIECASNVYHRGGNWKLFVRAGAPSEKSEKKGDRGERPPRGAFEKYPTS